MHNLIWWKSQKQKLVNVFLKYFRMGLPQMNLSINYGWKSRALYWFDAQIDLNKIALVFSQQNRQIPKYKSMVWKKIQGKWAILSKWITHLLLNFLFPLSAQCAAGRTTSYVNTAEIALIYSQSFNFFVPYCVGT